MSERCIYLTSIVDTGTPQFACEYIRNFSLTRIKEIKITPSEYFGVRVRFYFETSPNLYIQIDVVNAFNVGYRGEEPNMLHDLMIDAGFSEHAASRVFEVSRYAETILVK